MTASCAGGALPAVGELGEDLAIGVAALAVPHVQAEQALKEGAGRGVMMLTKRLSKNFKPGRGALLQRPSRFRRLAPPVQVTDGAGSSWNKIGNAQLLGNPLREWKRWQ